MEIPSTPNNVVILASDIQLAGGTTYYWRVDTVLIDDSVITGDIWSFETE